MYLPPTFRVEDPAAISALVARQPLAQLVTVADGRPHLTPVPVLLEESDDGRPIVIGHLAKANPQAAHDGAPAAIGWTVSSAYVSPSTYATKTSGDPRVVPTWNYEAVEAHGTLRIVDDPAQLLGIVTRLTDHHEARRADRRDTTAWRVDDAPGDWIERMLGAIVGFEIVVDDLRGKQKLSQNRPEADREGVAAELATGTPIEQAVAASMAELRDASAPDD